MITLDKVIIMDISKDDILNRLTSLVLHKKAHSSTPMNWVASCANIS